MGYWHGSSCRYVYNCWSSGRVRNLLPYLSTQGHSVISCETCICSFHGLVWLWGKCFQTHYSLCLCSKFLYLSLSLVFLVLFTHTNFWSLHTECTKNDYLDMPYCLALGSTSVIVYWYTDCPREPQLPQLTSYFLQQSRQSRVWQLQYILHLLSLTTHTMLLPANSQLYSEMQSHHFCQESHTETWLCFVSGHTVFDKIRRSHHINIFTLEETRRVKLNQQRDPVQRTWEKFFLKAPNLET